MQSGEATSPRPENIGRMLWALLQELGRAEDEHRLGRSPLPALNSARTPAHDALVETRRAALVLGPDALVGHALGGALQDELDRFEAATRVGPSWATDPRSPCASRTTPACAEAHSTGSRENGDGDAMSIGRAFDARCARNGVPANNVVDDLSTDGALVDAIGANPEVGEDFTG